jgi:hypothetical protein
MIRMAFLMLYGTSTSSTSTLLTCQLVNYFAIPIDEKYMNIATIIAMTITVNTTSI